MSIVENALRIAEPYMKENAPKVIKKKRNYISCAICGEEFAEDCAFVSNGKIICPDCTEH